MRSWFVILIAAIVLAFVAKETNAKFSFALPGKWANNKRAGSFKFSLPGKWGNMAKRSDQDFVDCSDYDPDAIFAIYHIMQVEAMRMNQCIAKSAVQGDNDIDQS